MYLDDIVSAQKRGEARGITSVCSAHPHVLKQTLKVSAKHPRNEVEGAKTFRVSFYEIIKLQQVTAPSAFANSSTVTGWTWYPRASSLARVFGKAVGKMIFPFTGRQFAANGSDGSTSIQSKPLK